MGDASTLADGRVRGKTWRSAVVAAMVLSAIVHESAFVVPAGPSLTLTNASEQQIERVEWAIEQFAIRGLELPDLDISFHDSAVGCDGNTGIMTQGSIADIEICMPTRHIILHELAHAWSYAALTDAIRNEFLAYWALEHWSSKEAPWNRRGIEKAADTIAFVLAGIPESPSDELIKYLCGYPLLTGSTPARNAEYC